MVVEVPKGTKLKYELRNNKLFLDRVLRYDVTLPGDYGIVPSTLSEDGEELDCVLLVSVPNYPGSIITAKPIGYLETEDEQGKDKKVIAVPIEEVDVTFKKINSIKDVPKDTLEQIKFYFDNYKSLEKGKWTKIGKFKNEEDAKMLIKESIRAYKKKYKPSKN